MKTISDLLNLIAEETKMSEGKVHVFTFNIDTKNKWVSMYSHYEYSTYLDGEWASEKVDERSLLTMESIDTDSRLQLVYWRIFNLGRSAESFLKKNK